MLSLRLALAPGGLRAATAGSSARPKALSPAIRTQRQATKSSSLYSSSNPHSFYQISRSNVRASSAPASSEDVLKVTEERRIPITVMYLA